MTSAASRILQRLALDHGRRARADLLFRLGPTASVQAGLPRCYLVPWALAAALVRCGAAEIALHPSDIQ